MNISHKFENNQVEDKVSLKTSNSDLLENFSDNNIKEHQKIVENL